jgi:sugar phosphate isomerase/epimerase
MSQRELSRRAFISSLAAATMVANVSSSVAAEKRREPKKLRESSGVRLAIATICMDGFSDLNFVPSFEMAPKLGIRNIEFNTWYARNLTPAGIESIKERCVDAGLSPICVQGNAFGDGKTPDVSHKLWCMEAASRLGARRVKFTGSKRDTNGGLPAVISTLSELAPAAEEMGMLVLVENHADNVLENVSDYEEIFARIDSPNVGLCLDTGHFVGAGVDLEEVIAKFHSRTLHIDLKDTEAKGKYKTVNYGSGAVDLHKCVNQMLAHGYTGYLLVEQAPPLDQNTLFEDLSRARKMFERYEQ